MGRRRKQRVSFPERVYRLLISSEDNDWEEIISWVDNGNGFKVHDRERFETLLLKKYFNNATQYASFTRQLHMYGFDCIRAGRQTGIYSHPNFHRDNPQASCSLERVDSKIDSSILSKGTNKAKPKEAPKEAPGVQVATFPTFRAGDAHVQFPSLLKRTHGDDTNTSFAPSTSGSSNNNNNSSSTSSMMVTGLSHADVSSQVADQTKRAALIRLPPQVAAEKKNPFQDNANQNHHGFYSLAATGPSRQYNTLSPSTMTAAESMTTNKETNRNYSLNVLKPAPLSPVDKNDDMLLGFDDDDDDDWGTIPWSPSDHYATTGDDNAAAAAAGGHNPILMDNASLMLLEPRPIEAMIQSPHKSILKAEWQYD